MADAENSQKPFRDYLLGRLTGEDLETFEKRLLAENEDFERLLGSAEDDLLDEYASGDLSKEDREAFEKHYLITNERYEDLDFARTLNRFFKKQPWPRPEPVPPRNLGWILRAAIAVVVVGFVAVPVYRLIQPSPNITTATLNPSIVTRGERPQSTSIKLDRADTLRLSLNLPAQFPAATQYRAELEGNPQVVKITNQDSRTVTVELPTEGLRKGPYSLKLFALPAGQPDQPILINYLFTVE